jgi:toxin YoeB
MEVIYTSKAQEDLTYWQQNDQRIVNKINKLISAILASPFSGIGKPEPLKFLKSGYWSRRINREHRLVYKVADNRLYIAQCRFHYEK